MKVKEGMPSRPAEEPVNPGEPGKKKGKAFAAVLKETNEKGKEPEGSATVKSGRGAPRHGPKEPEDRPLEEKRLVKELEGEADWTRLAPLPVQPQPLPQPGAPAPSEVEKPRAAAEVRPIDALAEEIVVAVREDGSTQIDIQLDSRTFDGLGIQITGDVHGAIAIQFVNASPQVERVLAENLANLSQALVRRDLNVSEIRVEPRTSAGAWKGGAGGRRRKR